MDIIVEHRNGDISVCGTTYPKDDVARMKAIAGRCERMRHSEEPCGCICCTVNWFVSHPELHENAVALHLKQRNAMLWDDLVRAYKLDERVPGWRKSKGHPDKRSEVLERVAALVKQARANVERAGELKSSMRDVDLHHAFAPSHDALRQCTEAVELLLRLESERA